MKETIAGMEKRGFEGGCGMRDAGCGMRDAGCGMQDAGCGMRDAGCGMRDAGWQMAEFSDLHKTWVIIHRTKDSVDENKLQPGSG